MNDNAATPVSVRSAVAHRDHSSVRLLVATGSILEETDHSGVTPFRFACATDQFVIARKVLSGGANASVVDQFGRTPLHFLESSRVPQGSAEVLPRQEIVALQVARGFPFPPPDQGKVKHSMSKDVGPQRLPADRDPNHG